MTANKHTPMVVAAAGALCRRNSDLCNVDFDDNWKLYGCEFLMDAQVALESAAAPELLEALIASDKLLRSLGFIAETDSPKQGSLGHKINAAIAKATGGAA